MNKQITIDMDLLLDKMNEKAELLQKEIQKKLQMACLVSNSGGVVFDMLGKIAEKDRERMSIISKIELLEAIIDDDKNRDTDVFIEFM